MSDATPSHITACAMTDMDTALTCKARVCQNSVERGREAALAFVLKFRFPFRWNTVFNRTKRDSQQREYTYGYRCYRIHKYVNICPGTHLCACTVNAWRAELRSSPTPPITDYAVSNELEF